MIYQTDLRLHEARMSPMPLPGATSLMAPTETPSNCMPTTAVAESVTCNQTKSAEIVDSTTKTEDPVVDGSNSGSIPQNDIPKIKDNKACSSEWPPPPPSPSSSSSSPPSTSTSSLSSFSSSSSSSCSSSSSSSSDVSSAATATTLKCDTSDIEIKTESEVAIKIEDETAIDNQASELKPSNDESSLATPTDSSSSNSSNNSNSNKINSVNSAPTTGADDDAAVVSGQATNDASSSTKEIEIKKEEDSDEGDVNSEEKPRRVELTAVNAHIVCNLCHGYLIDATTIVECLHSFCHSCIMQHLRTEQYCPRCEVMINTAKPNIKPDTTLQAIVYKLVPELYEKELKRKRAFYKSRPEDAALATPEQRGEDTEHLIFSPKENMSLSLEYADIDDHISSNNEQMAQLRNPKYLLCPAIFTVQHLKRFVYGKFDIDANLFSIDIMYKVKTIVLLDHYTLMDVAYIYTWKRDAPMRFYFRVKQRSRRLRPKVKSIQKVLSKPKQISTERLPVTLPPQSMTIIHNDPVPQIRQPTIVLSPICVVKQEYDKDDKECTTSPTCVKNVPHAPQLAPPQLARPQVERPQPKPAPSIQPTLPQVTSPVAQLKIPTENEPLKPLKPTKPLVVSKPSKQSKSLSSPSSDTPTKSTTKSQKQKDPSPPVKDERKVENIKLKIDLSKQNSVTIINMSDPDRKEIVKPVKPEKEWKVKNKKDKSSNSIYKTVKDLRRGHSNLPLTVPPLTIKAERINPIFFKSHRSPSPQIPAEDPQSQFLKSFSLTPKKDNKSPIKPEKKLEPLTLTLTHVPKMSVPSTAVTSAMGPPPNLPAKRKSKDPIKSVSKKAKFNFEITSSTEDSKAKSQSLQLQSKPESKSATQEKKKEEKKNEQKVKSNPTPSDDKLMPPPPPSSLSMPVVQKPPVQSAASSPKNGMKPPTEAIKKSTSTKQPLKFAPPGSLTPHPMSIGNKAPPGSLTPIAKRFQPILPKGGRPNPFANLPSDVNKILKDAGTEIKSISSSDGSKKKIYGPKSPMASPALTGPKNANIPSGVSGKNGNITNYLNFALYNATKSRGNEVPPGYRTPMYTPNSPIYSPNSPQYVPNYNIPTQPTYKYTPKPNSNSNYLQSVLGGTNNQLSSLFPVPPTKKQENAGSVQSPSPSQTPSPKKPEESPSILEKHLKRSYPFTKSPSPSEEPPEKHLKVKSLLNSCNINIPSSLSITITREDSETPSSGSSRPKRKSPVNNYIEILKLPDQPVSTTDAEKRTPPQTSKPQAPTIPQNLQQPHHNYNQNQSNIPQVLSLVSIQNMMPPKSTPPIRSTAPSQILQPPAPKQIPPLNPIERKQKQQPSQLPIEGKKTPSPDKKSPGNAPSLTEKKSNSEPNSPKNSVDPPASKKFRHILPRTTPDQRATELLNSFISNGLQSMSPTVAQKLIAPKKPTQKKPPTPPQPFPTQLNGNLEKKSPPLLISSVSTSANSKTKKSSTKPTQQPQDFSMPSPKKHSQMNSPIGPSVMPPQPSLTQADVNKFLNETYLQAKAQAAAAALLNPGVANIAPNMAATNPFFPYQSPQYTSMCTLPPAYIMEHFTRMRRAGNEALEQYMQKLKGAEAKSNETPAPSVEDRKSPGSSNSASSSASTTPTSQTKHK